MYTFLKADTYQMLQNPNVTKKLQNKESNLLLLTP